MLKKVLIGILFLPLLYALCGFAILPWWTINYLPSILKEKANISLNLEKMEFNPFTFELNLNNITLLTPTNEKVSSMEHLYIDYAPLALFKKEILVKTIIVKKPFLDINLDKNGTLNLASLYSTPKETVDENATSSSDLVVPLIFEHIELKDGELNFSDLQPKEPFAISFKQIDYVVNNLNFKKDDLSIHELQAFLQSGEKLTLASSISPESLKLHGEFTAELFPLSPFYKYLLSDSPIKLNRGNLTLKLPFYADLGKEKPIFNINNANFSFENVELNDTIYKKNISLPKFTISDVHFDQEDNISTHQLKLFVKENELLTLSSSMTNEPIKIQGNISIDNLALPAFYDYFASDIPAKMTSSNLFLNAFFDLDLAHKEPLVKVKDANLTLKNTAFATSKKEKIIDFPLLTLEHINFDLNKSAIFAKTVSLDDPFINIQLNKGYQTNLESLFTPKTTAKSTTKKSSQPAWNFELANLNINNASMLIKDNNVKAEPFKLNTFNAKIQNITSDNAKPILYDIKSMLNKKSKLAFQGSFTPSSMKTDLDIKIDNLSLDAIQPYINPFTTLVILEGYLSTDSKINAFFGKNPTIKANSNIKLKSLYTVDDLANPVIAWEQLDLKGLSYASEPSKLSIKKIDLLQPYVNLDIKKDTSTNFANIVKNKSDSSSSSEPLDLFIGPIVIKNAAAHFKDESLPIPFATYINKLNGEISTLDTKNTKPSVMKLEGKIDQYGYANISGSMLPFDFKENANLGILFKNIDMASLTPYSGKFVGYAIKEGKLSMDLSYEIKKGLMEGQNKINLDSLTLGEKIESEDATSLPLELAIAILKDRNGQIDIDLPVSGDMNEPDFKYGGIVWKAIGNLFGSLVTSPFKLLGSMLGIESESLKSVDFMAGSDKLVESEDEKMEQYKTILEKRAELKLFITPTFSEVADTKAIKEQKTNDAIEAIIAKAPKSEDSYGKAIASLFIQKHTPEAYSKLKAELQKEKLDAGAINEMALKKIIESTSITQEELHALAKQRANTIITTLATKFNIPQDRLIQDEDIKEGEAVRNKWIACPISVRN